MSLVLDLISWLGFAIGGAFLIIGAIGVLRMPDLYTRLHAASLVDTLGASMMIGAMMVQSGLTLGTVKLALVMIFLALTGPVSSHALAGSALRGGLWPLGCDDRSGLWASRLEQDRP
ncbi:sodium:proton antiporter [Rhodospirillum rubrum]|uniref:monovalent cation/H(+) antiporter subunit G n=1 Tax=Rhodospirillum rubrum TaxID=1085 RepID=UPI0019060A91|nr:monovalent cation/H(+) antiporter subunit G [Rhodospirillum rubrum]MBK1664323.1 sodium:proton antiporter [Rhodospirillum rubrum]MBK1676768.1 sodium:proton antiporter [Rhodospirillum rubrum]